jgi:hypothetical protein
MKRWSVVFRHLRNIEPGWMGETAYQNLQPFLVFKQHQQKRAQFDQQFQSNKDNIGMDPELRDELLYQMKPNPKWITDFSFCCGNDLANLPTFEVLGEVISQ